MGLVNSQYLPRDVAEAMLVLGNAIAVPHALIAVLNCLSCIRDRWVIRGVQDIFADIMSQAIKGPEICTVMESEGYHVTKRRDDANSIPATLPMRVFPHVTIKSPLQTFSLVVQSGLCLWQVIRLLTVDSLPLTLQVVVKGTSDSKFPLPRDMPMTEEDITISTDVPSCLILSEAAASSCDWPFIAVLHKNDVLVVRRENGMIGTDLVTAIFHAGRRFEGTPLTDYVGRVIPMDEYPPNIVFVSRNCRALDFWEMVSQPLVFRAVAESFVASCTVRDVHAFIHWLENTGIHTLVRALGWHFMVQLNIDPDDDPKEIMLSARPGRLAIQPVAICQLIMTRIFIHQLKLI